MPKLESDPPPLPTLSGLAKELFVFMKLTSLWSAGIAKT